MKHDFIEPPLEILLFSPDDFLKVKETLTRIGVASRKTQTLYQSCHILHKKGQYYIMHFKELFGLDGKLDSIDPNDIARRNTIAFLLAEWNLLKIVDPTRFIDRAPITQIMILSFKDKDQWDLQPKYTIGK